MDLAAKMALPSSFSFTTHQDTDDLPAKTTGAQVEDRRLPAKRRRHSLIIPRRKSIVNQLMETEESLLLEVCCQGDTLTVRQPSLVPHPREGRYQAC